MQNLYQDLDKDSQQKDFLNLLRQEEKDKNSNFDNKQNFDENEEILKLAKEMLGGNFLKNNNFLEKFLTKTYDNTSTKTKDSKNLDVTALQESVD